MGKPLKISILHVVFLCMTVIGLKNHVTILPPILEVAGRDGWLSVILATAIVLPWLVLLVFVAKSMNGRSFIKVLEEKNGRVITLIIKSIIAILIFVLSAFTMVEMLQWVNITFLATTPMPVLFILYFLLCVTLAIQGLRTIVVVNAIVLFMVIVFGFFVAFVNIRVKDYSLLFPILEHGMNPVLLAIVFPMSGFLELIFLILIQHQVKNRIQFKHFAIMLFLLMSLTLGPLIGAIVEFGPDEASKQRYPAYEEWRLAAIGEFINQMDFLSIYQWMTGAFVRVGFYLYLVTEMFGISNKPKKIIVYVTPPFAFLSLILMLVDEQTYLYINNYIILIASAVLLLILGVVFALLIWRKKGRRQEGLTDAKEGNQT